MKHSIMDDWRKIIYLTKNMKIGDPVDDKIIHKLLGASLHIFLNKGCLQINEIQGEIYDAETNTMKPTYFTFSKKDGHWIYCGCCFKGKSTEPTLMI